MAQARLIPLVALHLALTGLPGIAASLYAARRGVKQIHVLICLAMAVSGATAMLAFWAYFATPAIGKVFAFLLPAVSIGTILGSLQSRTIDRHTLRQLATPFVLWTLGTYFLVFLGFVHGGSGHPEAVGATRFSEQLPSDNDIPQYFAGWFYAHGHNGTPPLFPGVWMASDRPPLQVGYVLAQRPFAWDTIGLNYDLLGIVLQQFWIVGVWAFLLAARVGRLTRALVMVALLVSDLTLVNGFFVWPKMLPTGMLLAACALLVTPAWAGTRRSRLGAVTAGALLALAMLGHGSSAFGVVPICLLALLRGRPAWRWVATGIAAAAVLLVPWSAYVKYGDPPGNRLAKWSLAGDIGPDRLTTEQALKQAYGRAGIGGTIHDKVENYVTMVGGGPMITAFETAGTAVGAGQWSVAVADIRNVLFYFLFPSLGLLLLAPILIALALARRRVVNSGPDWSFASTCAIVLAVGSVLWGLVLFGNMAARAVILEGSYLLPALGFCAGVAGARAAFPRLAIWLVAAEVAISLALYAPALTPPPGTEYSPAAIVIAALSLAAFIVVTLERWPERLRLAGANRLTLPIRASNP